MNRATRIGALILIVAAAMSVGLFGLARQPSDPPRDLSVSIGTLDEGIWSHNAVNDALFGRARLDDFNPMVVTSGSWLYRLSYAIGGVGIVQTRAPSIALGALAVFLVGLLLWRESPLAGVAAAWLFGSCYLFLAYSRLGLLESPAIGFALAGLALLVLALARERTTLAVVAGALLAGVVTVKIQSGASVLGLAAGVALWYGLFGKKTAEARVILLSSVAGFVAAGTIWVVFVITHLDAAARAEWDWHSSGVAPRLSEIPSNLAAFARASDGVGTRARPLLIAAAVGLLVQCVAWATKRWRPGLIQFAAAGWAAAGLFALAMLPYTPSRYAVLALPALALVAGSGVVAGRTLIAGRFEKAVAAAVLLALAGAAAIGIRSWTEWSPTYDLRATARMLARETRKGDVILGGFAFIPSMQTHRRVVVTRVPGINDRCPVERFGVDWVLINEGNADERAYYDARYPALRVPANRVATSSVLGRRLGLYRVTPVQTGVGCV